MSIPITIQIGSNTSTKPFESNLNVDDPNGWVSGLVLQGTEGVTYTRVGARLQGTSIVRVWPYAVVVSGGGGGTPALSPYSPAASKWAAGRQADTTSIGIRRNTFAFVDFELPASATQLDVQAVSDLNQIDPNYLYDGAMGVWITDQYGQKTFQGFTVPGNSTPVYLSVNLPAGFRTVRVVLPDQARVARNSPASLGTCFLGLRANAAPNFLNPVAPANRYIFVGDSIPGGGGATQPLTDAFPLVFGRNIANSGVTIEQVSGGALTAQELDISALIARIIAQADGTQLNMVLIQYGTNNAGFVTNTTGDFGTRYAQLVDGLRAARPDLYIVAITPFTVRDYDARLETYRQPIRDLVASRNWLRVIEGPSLLNGLPQNAKNDGVHLSTAQHAEVATNLLAKLTNNGYVVLNQQDFDSSSSLPATYGTNNEFFVATNEARVSGTRSLKQLVLDPLKPIGPTDSQFANGRFTLSVNALVASGVAYVIGRFGRVEATDSNYGFTLVRTPGNNVAPYLVRVTNGAQPVFLKEAGPIPFAGSFLRVTSRRSGNVIGLAVQQMPDLMYLTPGGTFTSSVFVEWATVTDPNALPLTEGTCDIETVYTESNAGNGAYYDDIVVEKAV